MNLNEVQAVYFLLNALQFPTEKHQEFNLVVSYKGKLLTADFLTLDETKTSIVLATSNWKSQLEPVNITDSFPTDALALFKSEKCSPYFSMEREFKNPELLLQKLATFVSEKNKESIFKKPVTNIVTKVNFLESNVNLDFALLEDDGFELVSILLKGDKVNFIEY